jgi:cell filamentation protein
VDARQLESLRGGNGRAQRAFFEQLARDAGFALNWRHLDATRNIEASAAIMRGDAEPSGADAEPMRKMLDGLLAESTG